MAGALLDGKTRVAAALRRLRLGIGLAALVATPAFAFDFARYQAADLDDILAQPRPQTGLDLNGAKPLRLEVKLVSYGETCAVQTIPPAMTMLAFSKEQIDSVQATRCIKVRSARGKEALLFIQDVVRAHLPGEVPLGGSLTLFAIHLFTTRDGPGLLVNEFEAPKNDKAAGAAAPDKTKTGGPCGCGTPEFHPGVDFTSDKAGAPVQAMDDGVVIRVEQNEQASVDALGIGRCGRYVVLKHSYPNGRVVFTRYGQLGRIAGAGGRPIAAGSTVKKNDRIAEVGPTKTLHLELRPITPATTQTDAAWQARYGKDPTMEWSRYDPVDPQKFDADVFGGRKPAP
jgi:Peptidase family M23